MRRFIEGFENIEAEPNGFQKVVAEAKLARECMGRVFFIGNGGSASTASHMAVDWYNKGGFAALAFNDPAALTCIANDYDFSEVFIGPISRFGRMDDILFAISCSGQSSNVVRAVDLARTNHLKVVTLTGFHPQNLLRRMGDTNFYVPSNDYGVVETVHLGILHALLDAVSERPPH